MATLLLSEGVPMILAGDEFLRTQRGNNNAWCQDNQISWVDWSLAEENKGFLRFVREMIWLRRRHPALRRRSFLFGAAGGIRPDIAWHGVEPNDPDFSPESRALAYSLDGSQTGRETDQDFYVAINGHRDIPAAFRAPPSPSGRPWRRVVDTSLTPPNDIVAEGTGPVVTAAAVYRLPPLSLAILITSPA
jgi:glycogen operon protein